MEEDPDFDYEMEPQTAYAAFQPTAEEAMDELSSEGMPMSDVGLRFDAVDKTGIDVDFYDPTALPKASAQLPSTTASSMQSEEIVDAFQASTRTEIAQDTDIAAGPLEVATKVHSDHKEVPFEAPQEGPSYLNGADQSQAQISENEGYFQQDDEKDKLRLGEDVSATQAALASAEEEGDQLQENGEETAQPRGEEVESAQDINGHAYYHSEEEQDVAVRVTFHGQDFVIWSTTDIPTFLAVARIDDTTDPEDEPEDVVQVEAPALEVSKDVLWQPLDSLFTGLRDKKALGEFLDESHELHIAFPDLDLDVAEDNLYCREITLDDLLQLHHGLGIATSLHIEVSERPRFITKYNELAQHVAGILGNQLEHSSDDEEEAANAGHSSRNAQASAEALYAPEGSQPSAEVATTEGLDVEHAAAPQNQVIATGDTDAGPDPLDGTAPHSAAQADEQAATNAEAQAAEDDNNVHNESEQHELETHEHDGTAGEAEEEEGVDELAEDAQDVQEEDEVEEEQEGEGGAAELVVEATVPEADQEATAGEEEEDVDESAHQDLEQDEVGADEEEGAQAEGEQGYEEEKGEEEGDLDGEGQEDEAEFQEEEDDDDEYADELGGTGEEAEQTFYTSVNDSSEAEEDELEEPEQNGAQSSALMHSAEHPESTYAYEEATDDEQDWTEQNEDEEQIVEYTEEQGEGIVNPGSPSSTITTSYNNTGAQRKRGLDEDEDEDGDAAYEQDDYEAESKRAKVD